MSTDARRDSGSAHGVDRRRRTPCFMDDNGDDALLYCGEDAGELERDDREPGTSSSSTCTAAAADDGGHGECFCYDDDDDAPVDTEFVVPAFSPPGRRPGAVVHRPGSWSESVSWILKVRSFHGFQPATAYLAVSYMDRFLSSRTLPDYGWASQLLCVACLSLAAKMEETSSPPLLNLQQCQQIEGTRFIFEPRTIQRMELIVLVELDWRLRSLTPFAFVDFFAFKAGSSGRNSRILALRTCQIILDAIHETEFLNHCASSMAAAAVLLAVNESPAAMACRSVSPESAASWCVGLTEEGISSCYQLLQQQQALNTARERRRHLMILLKPQLRPMNCSSVASSSSRGKRRKLGGHFGEE